MSERRSQHRSSAEARGDYRDIRQLRAIRYPVRQEIMDTLSATGPSTIPELATAIGVSAESLYFHMRALVDVGLVYQYGEKPTASRPAAVFDAVHRDRRIEYDLADPHKIAAYGEIAQAILRLFGRDVAAALESGRIEPDGARRNYWIGRLTGWLDAGEVEEANRHIRALSRLFRGSRPGPGKQLLTWVFGMAPLVRRDGSEEDER